MLQENIKMYLYYLKNKLLQYFILKKKSQIL